MGNFFSYLYRHHHIEIAKKNEKKEEKESSVRCSQAKRNEHKSRLGAEMFFRHAVAEISHIFLHLSFSFLIIRFHFK